MADQPQNVGRCAELREGCQRAIFSRMDEHHTTQMGLLSEIKEKIAYQNGVAKANEAGKRDWGGIFIKALFTWGPPVLFMVVLGSVFWLKTNGWI